VGEHTREVLEEELGLDDAAIEALVAEGVVTC
jgi:crotonobetainyl-CoA:carnitine CoA-transferase CaiB-like acyl-CoA transferase